jgi:hypothetical protein
MSEWISTKDRLPEESDWGILVWDGKRVTFGVTAVTEDGKMLWSSGGSGSPATITHWMPFTKPLEAK